MKRIAKIGFSSFILLISSLIIVVFLIAFSFIKNSESAEMIAHTWEVKNKIRHLSSTLADIESKKIVYIYTDQIRYKHSLSTSQNKYETIFSELKNLLSDNEAQLKRLKSVDAEVRTYLFNIANFSLQEKEDLLFGNTDEKSSSLISINSQIALDEMVSEEDILLESRKENYNLWKYVILIGLGIATIIIIISLYNLINRVRPLVEELVFIKEDLERSNSELSNTLQKLKITNQEKENEIIAKNKAFQQTEMLNNSLLTKNQQLDHFAYVASHDLQEPLRTVSNYLEIFQEDFPERLEGEASMYFDFINSAVDRMRKLISGLLSFSRLGTSGEVEEINLDIMLANIQKDFAAIIEARNITIEYTTLPTLTGYRIELKQLFQNLISNAIKFTASDVEPHLKINFDETANFYNFRIVDNGIGIPEKDLTKIFDMFSRLHSTKDYEGQGIGLAFCKKIVELHHGKIWVTSDFGTGTTVHFTIKKQK